MERDGKHKDLSDVLIDIDLLINNALILNADLQDSIDIRQRLLSARRQVRGAQESRPFGEDNNCT